MNDIRFIHIPALGFSAGYQIGQVTEDGLRVKVAEAHCSLRDQFSKKMARTIIKGRLACKRELKTVKEVNIRQLHEVPKNIMEWSWVEGCVRKSLGLPRL